MPTKRYVVALTPEERQHLAQLVSSGQRSARTLTRARILRQRVPVVAFVNNHYAGYAPETARQLVTLTG